ncbi:MULTISPECIES: efflux transporter outer membrane subunit [unclassified Caballeronia]|uniref:efflux transporter outer membrane subunit n=1 Tax=unclassified Caballeronia TaxID=2646786 RepID=UPI00285D7832|nr:MULTISPECIES: efflux transporter outer membrane subunit [unclassified Caballeronia]MDR5750318.1 efflux transporter outer membrane subunit [Caballeronia sp. LZ024]MDR5844989.1 efflux transporter outer membrane subunit [Caballeronia sp. LZ031]
MSAPVSRRAIAIAALTVISTIAGCASTGNVAPESTLHRASTLDTGAAIRAADGEAAWPSEQWWRAYADPQLNDWVERANAGNPTLAMAAARVREARAMAGVARSALAPHVDGSLSLTRKGWPENGYYGPGTFNDTTTWNNTAALSLSYDLDLWGRNENATERALDAAHVRAADARAAQLELEANVVRAYIGMSQSYALFDIAQQTLEQQRKIVDLARRRLAGGLGTQLEVTQAETPLPEYERQIDIQNEAIELARNRLAALAGEGPGAGASLARPVLALGQPLGLPSALPAELVGHRPDVVAARWMVAAEARGIDVAKAEFYPNVDLLASVSQMAAGGALLTFLGGTGTGFSAGPALTLPIFEGGRLRSQLGAASAQYDQAVEHYNGTLVGALREIADQVVRMRSLDSQLEASGRSVAAASKNYRLANEGYRRGLTDYLNVLIAQTQLLRAQDGEARVRAERLAAYASLQAGLGGGLDDPSNGPDDSTLAPSKHVGPLRGVAASKTASAK